MLFRAFWFFEKKCNFSVKIPCFYLGLWTPTHPCYMFERTHILKCPCPKGSIVLSLLLACKSSVLKECHLKAAKQYNDDVTTASSKRSKFLLKVQLGGESSCICLIRSASCYSVLQEESDQVRDAPQSQIVCFFNIVQRAFDPPPPLFWTFMLLIILRSLSPNSVQNEAKSATKKFEHRFDPPVWTMLKKNDLVLRVVP